MASELVHSSIENRNPRLLEQNLSAFAHRYPVSGRIVHAIAQESGGVSALADRLEECGMGESTQIWMETGKPSVLEPELIGKMFGEETLDSIARTLGIPRESVEIQAALGIPKFFTTLGMDDDEDFEFGKAKKKKRSARHKSRLN
jgi:uncharacterized protein YidB (DUF937 family)